MRRTSAGSRFQTVRGKRPASAALIGAILAAGCSVWSCPPGEGRAYVFAVNFYAAPVSLRLGGEPGAVFAVDALGPGEASPPAVVRRGGEYPVLYRTSGREGWRSLPRELGAFRCRLQPGGVTALVVDRRGFIRAFDLGDDPRPGARLSFLNASDGNPAEMTVASADAGAFPLLRAERLGPNAASRFRSVVPGDYLFSAVAAGPPVADVPFACGDSSYWLLYCSGRGNAIVLHAKLLATRENGRLLPAE